MSAEEEIIPSLLLTVADAARYLGVGRKTVYRLLDEGRLTKLRVQGSTRLDRREVDDFKRTGQLT